MPGLCHWRNAWGSSWHLTLGQGRDLGVKVTTLRSRSWPWQLVLRSFVGLSSCLRQELSRLLVDKNASLSDRNSSFALALSWSHRVSKNPFWITVEIYVKTFTFYQDTDNSWILFCIEASFCSTPVCVHGGLTCIAIRLSVRLSVHDLTKIRTDQNSLWIV